MKKDRGLERGEDITHERVDDRGDVNQGESVEMAAYTEESEVTEENIDYYIRPHQENLKIFFNYHPQQTSRNPLVQRVFWCKDGTNRRWLTYCQERHALHCSVCIAFAKLADRSPFISGMTDWKHVHQHIEEHEKSMTLNIYLVEVSCPHTENKSERGDKYWSV